MTVIMSPNPKRIRIFINSNGEVKQGGIEENLGGGVAGWGNSPANRVPEPSETNPQEIREDKK